jgi:hypothetical protein
VSILAAGASSAATFVTVDPQSDTGSTATLGAGTYKLDWVSGAWNPYGYGVHWTDRVEVIFGATDTEFELFSGGGAPEYASAGEALAAYQAAVADGTLSTTFTVASATLVTFKVNDTPLDDNIGSFTVSISQTPLPAALPLFAIGLGAVGLLARRRKRKATVLPA